MGITERKYKNPDFSRLIVKLNNNLFFVQKLS